MRRNKNFFLVLLSLILIYTGLISAAKLSLEEAIELGLENNKEIDVEQEKIRQIERDLTREIVSNDWQINLRAGYDYNFTVEDGDVSGGNRGINPNISGSKTLLSGLNLAPEISFNDELDPSFDIDISYPLYPQLPTPLAEEYYRNERKLLKAHRNLTEVKVSSILSWLKTYLNIEKMTARQEIYNESLKKAEDNLKKIIKQQQLGAITENDVLAAELSLENAKYSLLEAENRLEDTYYTILSGLGLSIEEDIVINDKNKYLDKVRNKVLSYAEEFLKLDNVILMDIIGENNSGLQANIIDREVLEQELKWLKKGNDPSLNLTASYDTDPEDLSLSLDLSYQLYDGGLHKMALEDKEKEIADNLSDYDDLYDQLKQELKQHLDKLELSQMALNREKLSLARSQHELEVAEKQLEMGLIDYLEYQEKWIAAAEAKIDIASLEDQLLFNRLEFVKFLDLYLVDEIIGGF